MQDLDEEHPLAPDETSVFLRASLIRRQNLYINFYTVCMTAYSRLTRACHEYTNVHLKNLFL